MLAFLVTDDVFVYLNFYVSFYLLLGFLLENMDNRWYSGKQEMHNKRQLRNNEAYEATILEDLAEDFRLPIDHRVTENVDLDNVEQASLDTQLPSSNIGFRLLQKMGWKGKGLGKDEQGIIEPIKSGIRDAKLGLGKQEEDDYFTAEENIQRRKLDIEVEETEELAKKREVYLSARLSGQRKYFQL